jgi:hypothetical protein
MKALSIAAIVVVGVIFILIVAKGLSSNTHIGSWPEQTQAPQQQSVRGCRIVEIRSVDYLGVGHVLAVEAFSYHLRVAWCWNRGEITDTVVAGRYAEIGGIPGWRFKGDTTDSSEIESGVGKSFWNAFAIGEFEYCAGGELEVHQADVAGDLCIIERHAVVQITVTADGEFEGFCGRARCEVVEVIDAEY